MPRKNLLEKLKIFQTEIAFNAIFHTRSCYIPGYYCHCSFVSSVFSIRIYFGFSPIFIIVIALQFHFRTRAESNGLDHIATLYFFPHQ